MIRPMIAEDIPRLIEMGKDFHREATSYHPFVFSEEKLISLGYQILDDFNFMCLVHEGGEIDGMIAGAIYEQFFSFDLTAAELFLFVDKSRRGAVIGKRLVSAFEMWATSRGAREIRVGVSSGITPDRTVGFYEHLGYHRTAIQLRKVL